MTWIIILVLFLTIIIGILFVPIYLYINTIEDKYNIGLRGIINVSVVPDEDEIIIIHYRIFFLNFRYNPLKQRMEKKTKKKVTKKKSKKLPGLKVIKLILKMARSGIQSFKVRKFSLSIDTDDVVWNGYLIPVFNFANLNKSIQLEVNYSHENKLIILVENCLFLLLYNLIKTYIKFKY